MKRTNLIKKYRGKEKEEDRQAGQKVRKIKCKIGKNSGKKWVEIMYVLKKEINDSLCWHGERTENYIHTNINK